MVFIFRNPKIEFVVCSARGRASEFERRENRGIREGQKSWGKEIRKNRGKRRKKREK